MKGIIMTVAIAAGMAIGGAASGQTQEEVTKIIRRAKRIRIAELKQCKATPQQLDIAMSIAKYHFEQVAIEKVSPRQLLQAVCRYMNDMK